MAINNTLISEEFPFLAFPDPRLPTAIWFANGFLIGDASGGNMTIQVRLRPAGERQFIGNYWSLEQLHYQHSDDAGNRFTVQGFQVFDGGGAVEPGLPLALERTLASESQLAVRGGPPMPMFLGGSDNPADEQRMTFIHANVLADNMQVAVMGYRWDSSVRSLQGGPLRPPGSVFGS